MANEQITFDKLPQAVGYLTEQMEQIPANGSGTATADFFRQASSY